LAALDQEFALSAGAEEPNVIPVATAMDRMLAERTPTPALRESTIDDDAGQEVFNKVMEPGGRDRLLRLLSTNQLWREDAARLKASATVDPVAAGLRPRVRLLTDTEWQTLHVYLKVRYPLGDQ